MTCNYNDLPITIKRGDTDAHAFQILDNTGLVDVSGWTNLKMAVNTSKTPTDTTGQIGIMTGIVTNIDGEDWLVFVPPGTWLAGDYHYDASRVDVSGRIGTFIGGTYTIQQDITKE